jgi:two-component system, cell cycle sensor histidine kinase and response regulator CckA
VLLVEDQDQILDLLCDVLRDQGHEVHVASSGTEALELVTNGLEPTVLVTDVMLPGLRGPELAVEVRKLYPNLPVLFMSGYSAEALTGGLLENSEFLGKPFRVGSFLRLLEQITQRGQPQGTSSRS